MSKSPKKVKAKKHPVCEACEAPHKPKCNFRGAFVREIGRPREDWRECRFVRCRMGEAAAIREIRRASEEPSSSLWPTWSYEKVDGRRTWVLPVMTSQKKGAITGHGSFVAWDEEAKIFRRTGQRLSRGVNKQLVQAGIERAKKLSGK